MIPRVRVRLTTKRALQLRLLARDEMWFVLRNKYEAKAKAFTQLETLRKVQSRMLRKLTDDELKRISTGDVGAQRVIAETVRPSIAPELGS